MLFFLLYQTWKESVAKMCAENMANAKENAIRLKRYILFNGKLVPWVPVKLDGGWCKRTYGHSYNAKSGVVRIKIISFCI